MAENQYYDFLLVGKTGMGKSSTGNKLLNRSKGSTIQRYWSSVCHFLKGPPEHDLYDEKRFVTAEDVDADKRRLSVTGWCEVLASDDTNVRILDVPGFSDTGIIRKATEADVTVYEANLQIFRWIVRVQHALKITTNRVIYFLPHRGALEKADGSLQDELKVMHYFFGPAIFENMVAVATNHPRKQANVFDETDKKETQEVLHEALKMITSDPQTWCPPVVYIPLAHTGPQILDILIGAPVKSKKGMELRFRDDVCAKCTVRTRYVTAPGSTERRRVCVVYSNGSTKDYEDSKCHPKFVPRYTTAQKFWGGFGHVFTLGIGLLFKNSWPGWTNSDEMCESCKGGPGSKGCKTVGDGKVVMHSSEL